MEELEKLEKRRESLSAQGIKLLFQLIALILIPALVAVVVGNYFHDTFNTSSIFTFSIVIAAQGFSWYFIIKIYKKFNKEMEFLDTSISSLKKKLNPEEDNKK